jgi:hypothetical protein
MKQLLNALLLLLTVQVAAQTKNSDTITAKIVDSVTVMSKKPFIQVQVDKVVMNVDSRPTTAGQNALELLKQAPGVVVDGNETIQMGGKPGVQVLIDGRNLYLDSRDLAELLKSIDANNIKELELITNPSAKYDAAGNAGIINIKLKKSIINGFNGNVGASNTQSTHARQSINTALNFRRYKLNWYANAGFNNGYQNTTANNDRSTATQNFVQRGVEGDVFNGGNIRTGIDYSINKKHTMGVLFMNNYHNTTMDNNSNTLLQKLNAADTSVQTRSVAPFKNNRNNWNLNYKYSHNNEELNIDADYTQYKLSLYNTVNNDLRNEFNKTFSTNATQNNVDVRIYITSVRADYSKKLKGNATIEAGAKYVSSYTTNNLQVLNAVSNSWLNDTGKTNQFTYKENIAAAYVNFNKQWNKFTLQAGLRAEHTKVLGRSTNLKNQQITGPDTNYLNLFPTLFVQYKINEQHQLGFNYSRRIDRPSYEDQNPFIYVLDAFNSQVGNPYLQPQFTHAVEVSYTYKYAMQVKLRFATTNNYIEQLTYQNGNSTVLVPQNAGTRNMINLSFGSPFQPTKWWNAYLSAEPFWQQHYTIINGYGVSTVNKQSSIGFNGYLGNWFTLKNNWKAELSGWFNYQNTTTIYTAQPLGSMNVGFSKTLLNNKATLRCTVNDVFNTQRWQQTVNTVNLNMLTYRKWESRSLAISFTYRFGNTFIKASRQRETGNENEQGRIKNK